MFCRNCGKEVDTEKCPYCGHDSSAPQTPENNSVFDEIPDGNKSENNVFNEVPNINPNYVNYYNNNTANPAYLQNPSLNLGWFKFLINFLLIFSAIANVIGGIVYLTGASYEAVEKGMAELVYVMFPALKGLDVFMGIVSFALAVLAIVIRFLLAGFKKIGPILLYVLYGLGIVINLVYLFAGAGIMGVSVAEVIDISTITSLVVSVSMIIINAVYFTKRRELFNK